MKGPFLLGTLEVQVGPQSQLYGEDSSDSLESRRHSYTHQAMIKALHKESGRAADAATTSEPRSPVASDC